MDEPQQPVESIPQAQPTPPESQPMPPPIPTPLAQSQQPIDLSGNKSMAILAYLGPLILIPFLTEAKNDSFVKFHLKQGLTFIIVAIIWSFVASALGTILWALGLGFLTLLFTLISLGLFVIDILGIVNAANGKMNPLPIIGGLGNKFTF